MTDSILLLLISKMGRTPSRNSAIAKKISGPGMSKEYYMSINEDDVYVLTQAELEKIFMTQFNRIIVEQMGKNVSNLPKVIQFVVSAFTNNFYSSYNYNNLVQTNYNLLSSRYHNQYSNYMARYPQTPNRVRFTQEEIDSYFDNSLAIVKSYVEKHHI